MRVLSKATGEQSKAISRLAILIRWLRIQEMEEENLDFSKRPKRFLICCLASLQVFSARDA